MDTPKVKNDIHIFVEEDSESSKDISREEMKWDERSEDILRKWTDEMLIKVALHHSRGLRDKKLYAGFGVPAVLIPIVLSGLTDIIQPYPLVSSLLMIASGILTGIGTFFNFGKTSTENIEYQNRYNKLLKEINKELNKPKRHRIACDVYLERVYQEFSALNATSPLV